MKKSTYCICGTALVIAAAVFRLFADGGGETFGLALLGIVLLIASADMPERERRA